MPNLNFAELYRQTKGFCKLQVLRPPVLARPRSDLMRQAR